MGSGPVKRLIVDLDGTLCTTVDGAYADSTPIPEMIERLRQYKAMGFEIAIHTSRNMRTYQGNVGKITANTLPIIMDWLNRHQVPYDEVYVGKPWCGTEGFYVDDRAVRPDEFARLSYDEIQALIGPGA